MSDRKKDSTVVRVREPLWGRIKEIKKETGKSLERIVAEAIEAGLAVKKFI